MGSCNYLLAYTVASGRIKPAISPKRLNIERNLLITVRGHSRSSKAALFDRAHATLYSSSIVNMSLSIYYRFRDIAAYWLKIEITTPLYSAPRIGGEAVIFTEQPLETKN